MVVLGGGGGIGGAIVGGIGGRAIVGEASAGGVISASERFDQVGM